MFSSILRSFPQYLPRDLAYFISFDDLEELEASLLAKTFFAFDAHCLFITVFTKPITPTSSSSHHHAQCS
jgi:hypothetical protein